MTKAVTLANLASGEALTVDETNDRVGIASTAPSASVDVKQTILLDGNSGVVTATSFVGDGSSLTGIANTAIIAANQLTVTGVVTAASFVGDGSALTGVANTDFVVSTATTTARLVVTNGVNVSGITTTGGLSNTITSGNVIALMDSTNNSQNHRVRINSQGSSSTTSLVISNSDQNNQTSFVHENGGALSIRNGQTAGSEPTSGSERLRIKTDGTVGINESSPNSAFKLDLGGSINVQGNVAVTNTGRVYFGNSDVASIDGAHGFSGYLKFLVAGAEKARIDPNGDFGVGVTNPTAKLHGQDDSATVTDVLKLRNYKSSVNTKPGLVFEASTSTGQGGNSYIRGLAGTDAGGSNSSNDSGMEFEVRQGGSGTARKMLFLRSDGEVRLSGVFKQNATDQNNSGFTANNYYAKTFGPSNIGPGGTVTFNTTNGHAGGMVHIWVGKNANAAISRAIGYPFHLRSTGQANLGSSIYDFSGTSGAPSFNFTQTNQGVYFQNNESYTVNIRGRFELYGSVDG